MMQNDPCRNHIDFEREFRRCFDSVSPSVRLERETERKIIEMLQPKAKRQLRRTACIALAALVLCIGAAFAAVSASGILDRLFGGAQPSQQALQAVVHDAVQTSREGVRVNVDEYLFDRNSLHMGWTVSSDRDTPVYYTTNYVLSYENPADAALAGDSVGGILGAGSSGEVGDNQLLRLTKEMPAHSGYLDVGYAEALNGSVHARLVVRAYETDFEAVELAAADSWDLLEDQALVSGLEAQRQLGITATQLTRIDGYAAFNEALHRLVDSGMDFDEANEAALVESGCFRELAVLDLNLDIQPACADAPRFVLDAPRSYELADAGVTLETLAVDTASTIIEYTIEAQQDPDAFLSGLGLVLLDQSGAPLNADYALSMSVQPVDAKNDLWRVSVSGNPLPESVTAITFVRPAALRRQQESSNDYYRRMAEAADPSCRFTIQLN